MDFEQRLERAIERGRHSKEERGREAARRQLTEEELRHLHSSARLELAEHIDNCLRAVADRFPGFTFSTIAGEEGWGAKITRDDVQLGRGAAETVYSRLELLVRPFSTARIVELLAKGTIRNREVLNRTHFQRLGQLDVASFTEQLDLWVLEYAERFAGERYAQLGKIPGAAVFVCSDSAFATDTPDERPQQAAVRRIPSGKVTEPPDR